MIEVICPDITGTPSSPLSSTNAEFSGILPPFSALKRVKIARNLRPATRMLVTPNRYECLG